MITVGFKPAKAEIHTFTPADTALGQLRAGQGEPNQQHWEEDLNFIRNTDELRASPTLFVPKFSHHLPRRAYITVPIILSSNYLSIYLPGRLWLFSGQKLSLIYP